MDKQQQQTETGKREPPAAEAPVRNRGYSGRGAAAALETLKRLERVMPKPDAEAPRT